MTHDRSVQVAFGPRLLECTDLENAVDGRSASGIFASPDDLTFRSCMTLFEAVADDPGPFETVLERYHDGDRDSKALQLLADS